MSYMAFPPPRPLRNAFAEANASSADGRDHIGEVIDREASSNPSSEPLPPAKEFACHLVHNKSKKAWATLSVLGDAVQSKGSPAILQDTPISGEVRLDLGSGESIHSIILLLRGQVITGATLSEMFTFFELPTTLWTRSMGDPRNPSISDRPTKWGEKLKGAYTWPFSVTLPATVTLPVGRREEVFPLPQTFFERHTRARIKYELSVRFQRTGLRTDHRLSTTLNYLPVSRPGPASRLRQLSYQQHTALLGPDADPEGWHAFPVVKTRGRLPGCPSTEVKCTLILAKPLCYTLGTSIPCALVVECYHPPTLQRLADPASVPLRLRRSVRFHAGEKTSSQNADDYDNDLAWKEETEFSELASWWPAADRSMEFDSTETLLADPPRRLLRGELHLRPDLIVSSSMAHYRIEYAVVLFPFDAPGFESPDTGHLFNEVIEIASDFADGPRPLQYTEPFATVI